MLIVDFINSFNNILIHQSFLVVHVFATWFMIGVLSQGAFPARSS